MAETPSRSLRRGGKTRSLMDVAQRNDAINSKREQRLSALESQLSELQSLLSSLEATMGALRLSIDELRPNCHRVLANLAKMDDHVVNSRNNLVLHNIAQESLELRMASEPAFSRDVLETRVKQVFRQHLRISRDMPLTQVHRMSLQEEIGPPPVFVSFKSVRDKECILQHSNLLRRAGIVITEDFSGLANVSVGKKKGKRENSNASTNSSASGPTD